MEDLEVTYALHQKLVGKPMNDFLFVIIELFSLAVTTEALQGKTCQDSLLSGEGRSLGAKISW